jgi:hypothetical protein
MLYFENLPVINYDSIDTEIMAKMRNIFYRLDIVNLNENYVRFYRINNFPRLDNISYDIYGTTDYWWIIAIINDIHDIMFDIPIDEDILHLVATDRAIAVYGTLEAAGALTYRSAQLEELILENDSKRLIRIINERDIGKIITELLKSI